MNWLIALMLLLPPGVAMSPQEKSKVEQGGIVARMTNGNAKTHKLVMAVGMINASPDAVWKVLTDYEHYPRIFNGIKSHQTVSQADANHLVNKVVVDSPWPLPDRWTLNSIEHGSNKRWIKFQKIDGEFKTFMGEWQLVPQGKGTLLVYKVNIDPGIPLVPDWLINMGTKQILPGVIKAVRQHVR